MDRAATEPVVEGINGHHQVAPVCMRRLAEIQLTLLVRVGHQVEQHHPGLAQLKARPVDLGDAP